MKSIQTKFMGPTNYRGSRVKAFDCDGNTITISWDHSLNSEQNHDKAVKELCKKMNWSLDKMVRGYNGNGNVYVFLTDYNVIDLED